MLTALCRDADLSELTLLGGFKNNRSVFDWCAQLPTSRVLLTPQPLHGCS
jgi:hypothetical protein